jgi:chloride channel 3/4/5
MSPLILHPYMYFDLVILFCKQVKDSYRLRHTQSNKTLRGKVFALWDSSSGWLAAALIGTLTACIAFAVDVAEATVSDWKFGYCARNPLLTRDACCQTSTTNLSESPDECRGFEEWSSGYSGRFGVYVGFALVFGVASSSLTMLTRSSLPTVADTAAAAAAAAAATTDADDEHDKNSSSPASCTPKGKTMYMAAGSGIPEIKTILGGFVIPNFLSLRVLLVKALGAVFAVATGESKTSSTTPPLPCAKRSRKSY